MSELTLVFLPRSFASLPGLQDRGTVSSALSPGALSATSVWLAATAGFGFYVSNFGN